MKWYLYYALLFSSLLFSSTNVFANIYLDSVYPVDPLHYATSSVVFTIHSDSPIFDFHDCVYLQASYQGSPLSQSLSDLQYSDTSLTLTLPLYPGMFVDQVDVHSLTVTAPSNCSAPGPAVDINHGAVFSNLFSTANAWTSVAYHTIVISTLNGTSSMQTIDQSSQFILGSILFFVALCAYVLIYGWIFKK